jgi:hypothetical protein
VDSLSFFLFFSFFFFFVGAESTGDYLALKKSSLEPNEGFMLASLYKPLLGNILFTSSQLVLAKATAKVKSSTVWGPPLLLLLSLFSHSLGGCGSFPKSIPGASLCFTLPSHLLRVLYLNHSSANVTIVSLPGTIRTRIVISLWGENRVDLPPT